LVFEVLELGFVGEGSGFEGLELGAELFGFCLVIVALILELPMLFLQFAEFLLIMRQLMLKLFLNLRFFDKELLQLLIVAGMPQARFLELLHFVLKLGLGRFVLMLGALRVFVFLLQLTELFVVVRDLVL